MFAWFAVSYDLTVWAHYINHPYKQIHIVIFSCSSHINCSYIHDNTDHNKWRGWPWMAEIKGVPSIQFPYLL